MSHLSGEGYNWKLFIFWIINFENGVINVMKVRKIIVIMGGWMY